MQPFGGMYWIGFIGSSGDNADYTTLIWRVESATFMKIRRRGNLQLIASTIPKLKTKGINGFI